MRVCGVHDELKRVSTHTRVEAGHARGRHTKSQVHRRSVYSLSQFGVSRASSVRSHAAKPRRAGHEEGRCFLAVRKIYQPEAGPKRIHQIAEHDEQRRLWLRSCLQGPQISHLIVTVRNIT